PTVDRPADEPSVSRTPRRQTSINRPVPENDALHASVHRGLEERPTASPELTPRVGSTRAGRRRFHERLLRLVENGKEDRLLIREMMVEGALRDARAGGDVLDERPRVAADAKELAGHGQELPTRRLGTLLLGRHAGEHNVSS